jgi:hypothetical protein
MPRPENTWTTGLNEKLRRLSAVWHPLSMIYDELYFHHCQRRSPPAESLDKLHLYPAADAIVGQASTCLGPVCRTLPALPDGYSGLGRQGCSKTATRGTDTSY